MILAKIKATFFIELTIKLGAIPIIRWITELSFPIAGLQGVGGSFVVFG
jgi:hypothetical protein